MGNVVSVNAQPKDKKIADMNPGEVGYAVEWAYDGEWLSEQYTVEEKPHGTVNMRIECVKRGKYAIAYAGNYNPTVETKLDELINEAEVLLLKLNDKMSAIRKRVLAMEHELDVMTRQLQNLEHPRRVLTNEELDALAEKVRRA